MMHESPVPPAVFYQPWLKFAVCCLASTIAIRHPCISDLVCMMWLGLWLAQASCLSVVRDNGEQLPVHDVAAASLISGMTQKGDAS
jgi:hypothetical protein